MGIIGVVAALTLPNLNSSTGDKEKVTKVKKIYSNLNDAYGRATAVYGPLDEWFKNDSSNTDYSKRFMTRLTEFMKVSKDCGFDVSGKCFTTKDKNLYDNTYGENRHYAYNRDTNYKVVLADNTAISASCSKFATYCSCSIFTDIDSSNKGASIWGSDLFFFHVSSTNNDGIAVYAYKEYYDENPCSDPDDKDCAGWIITYDNADYLKTKDGKTCPNGKILSWGGNTSCN